MADLIPLNQTECAEAIQLFMNSSGNSIALLSLLAIGFGFLIGDFCAVYRIRKQDDKARYFYCCCSGNDENKGLGI